MTKNFKIKEFNCKCGCEMPSEVLINITKLANQLQAVRDFTSYPIIINSAYRCEDHNNAIGSNSSSQHILGKAADIVIFGLDPVIDTYPLFEDLILSGFILQGGLGMYNSFTHYDIRKTKARWNNAKL